LKIVIKTVGKDKEFARGSKQARRYKYKKYSPWN
jgi:hypothetical protein